MSRMALKCVALVFTLQVVSVAGLATEYKARFVLDRLKIRKDFDLGKGAGNFCIDVYREDRVVLSALNCEKSLSIGNHPIGRKTDLASDSEVVRIRIRLREKDVFGWDSDASCNSMLSVDLTEDLEGSFTCPRGTVIRYKVQPLPMSVVDTGSGLSLSNNSGEPLWVRAAFAVPTGSGYSGCNPYGQYGNTLVPLPEAPTSPYDQTLQPGHKMTVPSSSCPNYTGYSVWARNSKRQLVFERHK